MNETLSIATDARDSDRMADAVRILCTDGAMTLSEALDALTPPRAPQVGDILACGWGYEQTRYDFYQVIKVTKTMIKIAEIRKHYLDRGPYGHGSAIPVPDAFTGDKPISRRFEYTETSEWVELHGPRSPYSAGQPLVEVSRKSPYRYRCKPESYSTAYLWDGTECHESGDY